jgi:hypothetical protein
MRWSCWPQISLAPVTFRAINALTKRVRPGNLEHWLEILLVGHLQPVVLDVDLED